MKIKKMLLVLMTLVLNSCFAFDQSHLPNPPVDSVTDPVAFQRSIHLESSLQMHGVKNWDDWRVGEFGMYTVDEYGKHIKDKNGNLLWNTNTAQFWDGVWAEDTNGWRVELNFCETNIPDVEVVVSFGSVVKNSDGGNGDYFLPPRNPTGNAKFELKSPDGKVLQPNPMYVSEIDCPSRIPARLFGRLEVGRWAGEYWFVTNGPPVPLAIYYLRNIYFITNAGDYTLTVRPVLYQNRTGKKIDIKKDFQKTNTNYFDRVDLPSVTTKVYLVPNH